MSQRPSRNLQRRARALAAETGVPYQTALERLRVPSPFAARVFTGFAAVDAHLHHGNGARPGELMLVQGVAGVGRTRFLRSALAHHARRGEHGLLLALETADAAARLVLSLADESEVRRRVSITGGAMTIEDIDTAVRKSGATFTVLDGFEFITPVLQPADNDTRMELLVSLADIARRHKTMLAVTRQLPRMYKPYEPNELRASELALARECDYALQLNREAPHVPRWRVAFDVNRTGSCPTNLQAAPAGL